MNARLLLGVALALVTSACASTSPKEAYDASSISIEDRLGKKVHWKQGTDEDQQVEQRVHALLQQPINGDVAVQIALVNNPGLQATFEELRIAQADLVQAGLLKNPAFGVAVLFPVKQTEDHHAITDIQLDVVGNFLDVFLIPARKRIAAAALESAKLRVGSAAIMLAYDVESAFYTAQGAEQILAMRRAVLEAGDAAVEVARNQHDAGNISDLDLANEESVYEQLRLDAARAEAEVLGAREALTRLMGVFGPDTEWKLAPKLPELPKTDPPLEHLESAAIARRFDLAAIREDMRSIAETIALVKNGRWIAANVGAGVERTHEGPIIAGPKGSIELPIFDQKQAVIARLEGMLHQAKARETELAISIRSEVRTARARVIFARTLVERYVTVLVPLRQRVVELSQQQYDAMLLSVYQLLVAKQNEINAYRELIEAARDYWIARADLDRATGGRMPETKG